MCAVCGEGGAPPHLWCYSGDLVPGGVVLFWFLWFVFFRVWFWWWFCSSWSSVSADRTPARSDLPVAGALVRLVEEAMVSLMDEHVVIVGLCIYVTEEIDT